MSPYRCTIDLPQVIYNSDVERYVRFALLNFDYVKRGDQSVLPHKIPTIWPATAYSLAYDRSLVRQRLRSDMSGQCRVGRSRSAHATPGYPSGSLVPEMAIPFLGCEP